jgi:hypothetical protein
VRTRLTERGGDRQSIVQRLQTARRQHQNLRGDWALIALSPVIVAEFRSTGIVVQTVLEPGMPLRPGTPTMWA